MIFLPIENVGREITSRNKPGAAQVGATSTAQKYQKDFKVSKYSLLQHPKIFLKVSQCWKIEKWTFWDFSTSILSQNSKKLKGEPLRKKVPKKVTMPKNWKGDLWKGVLYVSQETFLVQSFGQRGQFNFCMVKTFQIRF